jgi:alkylated DNA repair dioxygenase AlkB
VLVAEQGLLPFEPEVPRTSQSVGVTLDSSFATAVRIQLDDTSWVDHVPGWLAGHNALMRLLIAEAEWEQRERWMYTRTVTEPRLTAEYPVITRAPHVILHDLANGLSAQYGQRFTRLWMNWYRDNNDGTGWHADKQAKAQPEAIIPVLSLGAARRFLIRPATGGTSTTIVANGGDLVVMGGRCQNDYQHCVPKQKRPAGARVSLNFSADFPRGTLFSPGESS